MAFDLSDELNYQVSVSAVCPSGFGDHNKTKKLTDYYRLDRIIEKAINNLKKPQTIGNSILKTIKVQLCTLGPEHIWEINSYKISDDKNSIFYSIKNIHSHSNFFTNIYKINVKVTCLK